VAQSQGVVTRPAPAARTRTRRRKALRRDLAAYLFLLPGLLHFAVFILFAVVYSFYLSFTRWDLLSKPVFIGLQNFADMVHDDLFWNALRVTLLYVVLSLPTGIALALALALALAMNLRLRGIAIFRACYFIPVVSSMVAVAMVWRWIYQPDFGLLNYGLSLLGIAGPDWLGDEHLTMLSLAILSIWKNLGFNMVLFLAGLQGIPQSLYEAAAIDGAGPWQRFRNITWPLLTPTTFFVAVLGVIGSFQVFDQVVVMTGANGDPGDASRVYTFYLYTKAFRDHAMGYAAALAWVLFAIIAAVTAIQVRFLGRRVNYEVV